MFKFWLATPAGQLNFEIKDLPGVRFTNWTLGPFIWPQSVDQPTPILNSTVQLKSQANRHNLLLSIQDKPATMVRFLCVVVFFFSFFAMEKLKKTTTHRNLTPVPGLSRIPRLKKPNWVKQQFYCQKWTWTTLKI